MLILWFDAPAQVEGIEDAVDNRESDLVEEAKDKNDNPSRRQDGDNGRHSSEKRFDDLADAGVARFAGLANLIFGIL